MGEDSPKKSGVDKNNPDNLYSLSKIPNQFYKENLEEPYKNLPAQIEPKDNQLHSEFSLDMVSASMDFEQAFSTYTKMQQKQAISAVEQLKQVQLLNNQYKSFTTPNSFPGNNNFSFKQELSNEFFNDRSDQIEPNASQPSSTKSHSYRIEDDFDRFFTSTESDALERFLDNLANPGGDEVRSTPMDQMLSSSINDLTSQQQKQSTPNENTTNNDYYTYNNMPTVRSNSLSPLDHMYDVTTQHHQMQHHHMPPHHQLDSKSDLSDVFSHYPMYHKQQQQQQQQQQLPTPGERTSPKRPLEEESGEIQKRKRSTTKQLLSIEQKRLNHSYSEQKRRQLCKLAYERCLHLIVNIDEYVKINSDKTVKRKQKIKNGLPNISKHTALVKLSEEIITIRDKNEALKKLLMNS